MSGAGVDPSERAEILLLRAEELLASGAPESVDEAVLALEGAQDVAQGAGVDQGLRDRIERQLADARVRRDGRGSEADGEEPEPNSE